MVVGPPEPESALLTARSTVSGVRVCGSNSACRQYDWFQVVRARLPTVSSDLTAVQCILHWRCESGLKHVGLGLHGMCV